MSSDSDFEIFPHELFTLIIQAAKEDQPTLLNLCLVSKAFLSATQRSLYRRVALGGIKVTTTGNKGHRWSIFDTDNDLAFLKVLTTTPHLAPYVRDLSFRLDTGRINDHFCHLFRRALHEMVNLKYLQLTLMTSAGSFFDLLDGLSDQPFQLEAFSWKDYRRKMSDRDALALLSFIISQPHLRALDILSSTTSLALPSGNCHNLSTFIGNLTLATSALQDRPISNFVWMGDQVTLSPLPSLDWPEGFSKLRVLIFYDDFPASVELGSLVDSLQSLEVLQLSFDSSTPPSGSALRKATELLLHLPAFKNLRMLSWIGAHPVEWHNPKINWVNGFKAAAVNFFDHHHIHRVYLWCPASGRRERYLCWYRDGPWRQSFAEVGSEDLMNSFTSFGFDGSLIDRRFIYGQ